jgi:6-phosphogluconolactonase
MFRDRRLFVISSAFMAAILFGCSGGEMAETPPATTAGTHIAFVGTYTQGAAEGIYAYRYNAADGSMSSLGLVATTPNPSFLALHPNGELLYAVNEGDPDSPTDGSISAFSIDQATGGLTFLNKVDSMGAAPCHIVVDHTGKFVFAANFVGGNVVSYRLGADGSIGERASLIQHEGSSVHPRQEAPHAHEVVLSADNSHLFVPDLGMDRVMVYQINAETGELTANDPPAAVLNPGTGPRHMEFHPDGDHAYVIGEINSTITTFAFDAATSAFTSKQVVSTLPADFEGESSTAEIEISADGKFVYGSNRGDDSIAVFAVDAAEKTLTPVEHAPIQGETPRNFVIDPSGAYLFSENQNTNNIVQFSRDAATGKLTPTGQVLTDAPTPVCMVFLPTS